MDDDMALHILIALADLEDRDREAWVDHHILERTYREIGENMGVSHESVRGMCQRASRRIRAQLPEPVAA